MRVTEKGDFLSLFPFFCSFLLSFCRGLTHSVLAVLQMVAPLRIIVTTALSQAVQVSRVGVSQAVQVSRVGGSQAVQVSRAGKS